MSNWVCPYCQHAQVVQNSNFSQAVSEIKLKNLDIGRVGLSSVAIGCANEACRKLTLTVMLCEPNLDGYGQFHGVTDAVLEKWHVLPESGARPQPAYIPAPLVEDYVEACRVRDLSPKASATLARRCLQGMIRDFCGISKPTLQKEIQSLREAVDQGTAPQGVNIETVDAIDHVRSIGNIGAHMEKDINLIVEVDSGEAQLLIELIEMLFDEWYKARHARQERLSRIAVLSAEKKKVIEDGRAAKGALPAPVASSEDA